MIVCQDCGKEILRTTDEPIQGVSHGMCLNCYTGRFWDVKEQDLSGFSEEFIDQLPYGVIVLDRKLRVIGYSAKESKLSGLDPTNVVGRLFFDEIAPCMNAPEVGIWCAEHLDDPQLQTRDVEWVLSLKTGKRLVILHLAVGGGKASVAVETTRTENTKAKP